MREHVVEGQPSLFVAFADIRKRNLRLQNPSLRVSHMSQQSSQQALIRLLDKLLQVQDFVLLADRCLELTDDYGLLITTCVRWCSSLNSCDAHKVYAAAHIMRLWSCRGIDIQGRIFDFLAANPNAEDLHKPDIYKLISELVISGHFSLSRYLQWLMAAGDSMSENTDLVSRPTEPFQYTDGDSLALSV